MNTKSSFKTKKDAKLSLSKWKSIVAKEYNTAVVNVCRENSFAAWGSSKTRAALAVIKSPWGAWYKVFSKETHCQRKLTAKIRDTDTK